MNCDISLCLAGIRPQYWTNLYNSAKKACKNYSWELVVISPFKLPTELENKFNIKFIREFGNPVRATQRGISECEGLFTTLPCDDGFFTENSLDLALDLMKTKNSKKESLVCRYKEGSGYMNDPDKAPSFPISYWNMNHHLNIPGTQPDWKIAPQPMVNTEYLKSIGGFDCYNFEAMSMATWDICCRIYRDGGSFDLSPTEIMIANNVGAHGFESEEEKKIGGHSAIYHAQVDHDYPRFMQMQSNEYLRTRIHIDFDAWKSVPEVWNRRWGNKTLEELQ